MFGDMLGNLGEHQKAMKEKLATIIVEGEAGDGAIVVKANGNQEITAIKIHTDKVDMSDAEMIEDLLMVATNRALDLAKAKAGEEAQSLLKGMMPPGMGGLGNLFG